MAGLGLSLIGTVGCIVVLGAAVSFAARQAARRARKRVPPAPAASEGYAGNKPQLRREHYVASDPNARRVP